MIRYKNSWGGSGFLHGRMTFMAPDDGANATTGTGGSQSAGTGASGSGATPDGTSQPKSPWDNIPWDELDDNTKRTLETARADHQKVAGENATLQEQARQRQQQQQQQPTPKPADATKQPNPIEDNIRVTLKAQGYNQAQIDAQAPALAAVMAGLLPVFKQDIGRDLAPLANTVVQQQNTSNFEAAVQSSAGSVLLSDPAIAQHVWNVTQQQTQAGRTLDPDAILNLAKMEYVDKQLAAGQPAPVPALQPSSSTFFPTVQQPQPVNRNTGYSFPGAYGLRPATGVNTDTNGPKHAVNADTQAALATTFAEMKRVTGVAPKAYGGSAK